MDRGVWRAIVHGDRVRHDLATKQQSVNQDVIHGSLQLVAVLIILTLLFLVNTQFSKFYK